MTNELDFSTVKIKRQFEDTERLEEETLGGSGLLKIGFSGLRGAERL